MIIGLTGSIATGKSTVSQMFREKGIPVVDADEIARDVVKVGQAAYNEIVHVFGKSILLENGEINRPALGAIVFQDDSQRQKLNQIVHPAIRQEMLRQRDEFKQHSRHVVLDIPLLFESNLQDLVEYIVVVYVDEETQLQRLCERNGYTLKEAQARMQSQQSIEKKKVQADYVIDNCGTRNETKQQMDNLLKVLENKKN